MAQRLAPCLQQLRELIARDKNHPSTVMWNVANETPGGALLGMSAPVPKAVEAGMRFFRQLYAEAHRLDGTRPVTLVGVQGGVRDWHGFLEVAALRPFMAGMHVWNFVDFKTGQGTRRAAGMNFKGVFTRDRRPKLAAHFLRALGQTMNQRSAALATRWGRCPGSSGHRSPGSPAWCRAAPQRPPRCARP
jgi:beta-galactosidase/beta-glucuronidase